MTWLKYQLKFINDQLIPAMSSFNPDEIRLIHCGDVFDSRTSVDTVILKQVRELFKKLSEYVREIIIIAGNHDFSMHNSDRYCLPETILSDIPKIRVITREIQVDNKYIYIPWYPAQEDISSYTKQYKDKIIFTHTDLILNKPGKLYCPVITGHIHTPLLKGNIYNLGSCYPLTFADANQIRYYYTIKDEDISTLAAFPNTSSISFYRFNDLSQVKDYDEDDYIEVTLPQSTIIEKKSKINKLHATYKNLVVIPQFVKAPVLEAEGLDLDKNTIDDMITRTIPQDLIDIYKECMQS